MVEPASQCRLFLPRIIGPRHDSVNAQCLDAADGHGTVSGINISMAATENAVFSGWWGNGKRVAAGAAKPRPRKVIW